MVNPKSCLEIKPNSKAEASVKRKFMDQKEK